MRLAIIDVSHGVADAFCVITLIRKEGTLLQRDDVVGCGEDVNSTGGVGSAGRGGQLVERQTGDAVHQHMAFVSPVELIPPLIVLVGGIVDAEGAIRVTCRVVFLGNFAFLQRISGCSASCSP